MPKTCFMCGVEYDGSKKRAFHVFPKDPERKKEWLSIVGKESCYKGAVICGDHFSESEYHDTDGYTTRRRLLSTAVPKRVIHDVSVSDPSNRNDLSSKQTFEQEDSSTTGSSISNDITSSSESLEKDPSTSDDDFSCDEVLSSPSDERSSDAESIKKFSRKKKSAASSNYQSPVKRQKKYTRPVSDDDKIFVNISNTEKECFTRQNFNSDHDWHKFLKHVAHQNEESKIFRQKCSRLKKKVNSYSTLVEKLRSKNLLAGFAIDNINVKLTYYNPC